MVPQTLFPTPEASALMSGSSASLLAAAASSASNLQAEAARHFLHQLSSSHALNPPSQVDLRESSINNSDLGVWAVETIPQGTRFGPFMGKWTMEPSNPKFAWEVSAQWTIYSATSFLEKYRKVVLEKWFYKVGFFFLVNHFSPT